MPPIRPVEVACLVLLMSLGAVLPTEAGAQATPSSRGQLRFQRLVPAADTLANRPFEPRRWGRSPFLTPEEVEALKQGPRGEEIRVENLPTYTVSAVIIASEQRVAVLNGRVVKEGETVDGETVLKIQPRGVVLGIAGRSRLIPMKLLSELSKPAEQSPGAQAGSRP